MATAKTAEATFVGCAFWPVAFPLMPKNISALQNLIMHRMAALAIPPGTGNPFGAGMDFLSSGKNISEGYKAAHAWAAEAVNLVRTAPPPNPWAENDDETIAAEIMRRVNERNANERSRRSKV